MMRYKNYFGKVEFDGEAKVLHGEVVGLRDVVTFQADSVEGIEAAFRESVDDYLAFCRARGEQPEKPFSGQFVVRADADLHRRLSAIAQASGRSLNAVVVDFLRREAAQVMPRDGAAPRQGNTSASSKGSAAKAGARRGSGRTPRTRRDAVKA